MKIKNRHRLKSKEIKKMLDDLQSVYSCDFFSEKNSVETGDFEGIKMVLIDNRPYFMYLDDKLFFTLSGLEKYKPKERFVTVDMGAVKFVTNGADVMAPGIVDADKEILENDHVWICDERNHKPLAVGIALMPGEQMISEKKGKAITLIHYVGDRLWNFVAKNAIK